jgi:hypothetical protein
VKFLRTCIANMSAIHDLLRSADDVSGIGWERWSRWEAHVLGRLGPAQMDAVLRVNSENNIFIRRFPLGISLLKSNFTINYKA